MEPDLKTQLLDSFRASIAANSAAQLELTLLDVEELLQTGIADIHERDISRVLSTILTDDRFRSLPNPGDSVRTIVRLAEELNSQREVLDSVADTWWKFVDKGSMEFLLFAQCRDAPSERLVESLDQAIEESVITDDAAARSLAYIIYHSDDTELSFLASDRLVDLIGRHIDAENRELLSGALGLALDKCIRKWAQR